MDVNSQRITEAAVAAAKIRPIVNDRNSKFEFKNASSAIRQALDQQEQKSNVEELVPVSETLNKFFETMNADLRFEIHEKTQRLMVKLVNTADNRVLKEFPPEAFLDTVAKIRDYIGVLLDKRA